MTALDETHAAILQQTTLFPSTIVRPSKRDRVLIEGKNNRKIGSTVTKGAWKGMSIYMLTLTERMACPTSCHMYRSCLDPKSRVLTSDMRWVPIDTLEVGQKIMGFDEKAGDNGHRMTRISTVEKLGRATEHRFRVTTDKGEVIASTGHSWLARKKHSTAAGRKGYGWIETKDLAPDDTISFWAEPWEHDTSYEAGRLRGFVEGEGHATTRQTCGVHANTQTGWAQLPGKLAAEIEDIALAKGFALEKRTVTSGVNASTVGHWHIAGGWRESLRFLGTIRPSRLMDKIDEHTPNHSLNGRAARFAKVISVEPLGEGEVVTIQTSTKTLVAEGMFSHNCYGNAMPFSRRNEPGPALEAQLEAEIEQKAREHRRGFVVRLHVLGDFYSLDYVKLWRDMIARHPELHVYGYTAPVAVAMLKALPYQAGIDESRTFASITGMKPAEALAAVFTQRMAGVGLEGDAIEPVTHEKETA